jgi:hypothetical protein
MAYVLRFVQRFKAADEKAFLDLEARFAALERRRKGLPRGRRSRPVAGRDPVHTLIWECELPTLSAVSEALERLGNDPEHERLLRRQIPYFEEAWTEVYEVLDFDRRQKTRRRRRVS